MPLAWYVMQSKPQKESQVYAYLTSEGFEVFYPTMHVNPVNPRSRTIRPYFPRYMFIHTDIEETGTSVLRWVPGAIGLVMFDNEVSPVPDNVIHGIKQRVMEIEEAGGAIFDGLKQGDSVRITSGPLEGYDAIFDKRLSGSQRVQIMLDMLGRQVKTQIDTGHLEQK